MRYVSTRGRTPALDFEGAFLAALASDGGLFVPESWPTLDDATQRSFAGKAYPDVACEVMTPFLGGLIDAPTLCHIANQAYARFRHPATTPLVQIDDNLWVLELFHGPTLAFKDVAMQVIGGLFDTILERRDERVTIIGATSGDTGSAAIEALRGRDRADVFILHPAGRTSDVQRKQMTTVLDDNVHNIAVEGTFDDCQALVKQMFADAKLREALNLSGVNSINWGRVMPQTVYYAVASTALGGPDRPVSFSVPTGNFGDIYAGYVAAKMGVPIRRLVVATNRNDILTRALKEGDHSLGEVHRTISPSMDIQVSSNFERLLFDLHDRDGQEIVALMDRLRQDKRFALPPDRLARLDGLFGAERVDEHETLDTIASVYHDAGYLIDPHTAVGVKAAQRDLELTGDTTTPMVVLSTAHPAKFPDAVKQATGVHPALPEHLADLMDREERYATLPNDFAQISAYVTQHASALAS